MWQTELILAKYHLAIAKKFLERFDIFGEKRFLMSAIKELASASKHFFRCVVLKSGGKVSVQVFMKEGINYGEEGVLRKVVKTIRLEDLKNFSSIAYMKDGKLIFLSKQGYKVVSKEDLERFAEELGFLLGRVAKN